MDQYILDNVDRFHKLVQRWKPQPASKQRSSAQGSTESNPNMIVAARLRVLLKDELELGLPQAVFPRPSAPGVLDIHELKRPVRGLAELRSADFRVDRAYGPDSTTEEIYADIVKPLVPWAQNGGIGTLFAYGQTGSGKTYTVSRLEKLVADELLGGEHNEKRTITMAMIELAGNAAYGNFHSDLLNKRGPISIREDAFGVIQLSGALEHRVSTTSEMLSFIETATALRRTEATDKNDASSRSHAICRIRIQQKPDAPDDDADGMLYLVDLAGSEAARDTANHDAQRMRETREINASLSVLKDCIRGKAEADTAAADASSKRKPHVPFRQTPLTKILKHVFDPAALRNCKTVVIACVNPCILDSVPSRNTLRYAETLRVIVPKVVEIKYDAKIPRTWDNKQLRSWIRSNSGSPPVDASLLAPSETGIQILRLDPSEFQDRCVQTPGVTAQQAMLFYNKLWEMHIDSQRNRQLPSKSKSKLVAASNAGSRPAPVPDVLEQRSSRDVSSEASSIHFKERIRPGMVVSWTPPPELAETLPDTKSLALILCPVSAAGPYARDYQGNSVQAESGENRSDSASYLCALVTEKTNSEAYEMNLWRQVVVRVGEMTDEVILKYDTAARNWYNHDSDVD
ncbi:unnamed protein product [Clonostachys rosea]|uniref:Kinesin-like protein n=1 Tax=Bionectria ochroleuca TaxID=29856 RepID=A0ABY6UBF2_BIOOC|nr:unnamed protein product [Clonostachys rosea]